MRTAHAGHRLRELSNSALKKFTLSVMSGQVLSLLCTPYWPGPMPSSYLQGIVREPRQREHSVSRDTKQSLTMLRTSAKRACP